VQSDGTSTKQAARARSARRRVPGGRGTTVGDGGRRSTDGGHRVARQRTVDSRPRLSTPTAAPPPPALAAALRATGLLCGRPVRLRAVRKQGMGGASTVPPRGSRADARRSLPRGRNDALRASRPGALRAPHVGGSRRRSADARFARPEDGPDMRPARAPSGHEGSLAALASSSGRFAAPRRARLRRGRRAPLGPGSRRRVRHGLATG